MQIRSSSYVDDIALSFASECIENNCRILETAAEKMLQLQDHNNIQFDMKKIELIHFSLKKTIKWQHHSIKIRNNQIEAKNTVK